MLKMFGCHIYPTKKQVKVLKHQFKACHWLCHYLLEKHRDASEQSAQGLLCYEQQATYPLLKQERASFKDVQAQALQNVTVRIDLAFKVFFRRRKTGKEPGSPRFKGKGRSSSLTFPQMSVAVIACMANWWSSKSAPLNLFCITLCKE